MHENLKLITAVSSTSKYKKIFKLQSKDIGDLMCWRDMKRTCSADCAAWDSYEKDDPNRTIVICKALPRGERYLAEVPEKEEKQEGNLDQ